MINQLFVIDDDDINDFILKRQIEVNNLNLDYKSMNSAQKALDYLMSLDEGQYPYIIFLDIHMPLMNGFEFLEIYEKELFPKYKTTKLFMVSSSLRESEIEKSKTYQSVSDFVSKPVQIDLLQNLSNNYESSIR